MAHSTTHLAQDLNFPEPYEGGEAVRKLFTESCSGIPDDLLFCIDEITTGDPLACGVTWHVELDGIPFPNGRGCSYYRISPDTGRLIYARDLVESALKPGEAAFSILRLLSPVVRVVLKGQRRDGASQSTGDLKVRHCVCVCVCVRARSFHASVPVRMCMCL